MNESRSNSITIFCIKSYITITCNRYYCKVRVATETLLSLEDPHVLALLLSVL